MVVSPVVSNSITLPFNREKFTFILKWVASLIQIAGYAATAYGVTPLNIHLFLLGISGWFLVGVLWHDKAIILIHLVALFAMIAGLNS